MTLIIGVDSCSGFSDRDILEISGETCLIGAQLHGFPSKLAGVWWALGGGIGGEEFDITGRLASWSEPPHFTSLGQI